ncbi:hypothetical protein ACWGBO_32030 [[Kitasatospora] papulosa]
MDERTAQWAVATVADVRDGWVCGARWAFSAQYRGLTLDAYGDTTGRIGGGGLYLTSVSVHAQSVPAES